MALPELAPGLQTAAIRPAGPRIPQIAPSAASPAVALALVCTGSAGHFSGARSPQPPQTSNPRHAPASARTPIGRAYAVRAAARRDTASFRTVLEQVPADAWGCRSGRAAEGTPKPANHPSIEA